jgi:hypothetical protein
MLAVVEERDTRLSKSNVVRRYDTAAVDQSSQLIGDMIVMAGIH